MLININRVVYVLIIRFEPYIRPITTWFVLILFCGEEYRAYFLNDVIIFLNMILILYIVSEINKK